MVAFVDSRFEIRVYTSLKTLDFLMAFGYALIFHQVLKGDRELFTMLIALPWAAFCLCPRKSKSLLQHNYGFLNFALLGVGIFFASH